MKMDAKFMDGMETKDEMYEGHREDKHKESRLMTSEDVIEELKKDFPEEMEDCKKYLCMAKILERTNHYEYAEACHYLTEISKDEYTHALFIHDFMCEHNIHIPEEQKEDFDELSEKMRGFFL